MALTAAEKMRRHRQKLKDQGKYDDYKTKHKENVKKYREKKKKQLSKLKKEIREDLKSEERRKTRERVAKCRALKRARKPSENNSPTVYRSAKSLGKATQRVKKLLPKSPRKRKVVVRKLFETYVGEGAPNQEKELRKSNSLALNSETINIVKAFYERDDVSRQAPGLKDVTTVKENGVKQKFQTRHLYSSIRETHAMFCSEFNDIKIGKSKFSELRPLYVKVSSKLPQNVCLCKYHENFILAVKALHDTVSEFPKYTDTFWNTFLCSPQTDKCWLGTCDLCKDKFKTELIDLLSVYGSLPSKWYVWSDACGVLQKLAREETLEELIEYITSIVDQFKEHVYVKRQQSLSYQSDRTTTLECRKESDRKIALMQVDFSENYTCIAQDEVQSYHWQQSQVSLFTSSICYDCKQHPVVIISDNTDHTKDTVVAYMSRLLEELPSHIREVRVWSDGPSSQFKNKFIAASLKLLEDKHNIKIKWNYFATSHGKGPVDGIGGSVKRQVRNAVLSRKDHVFNATDFYRVATRESQVKTINLTSQDIHLINTELDTKSIFEECEKVTGISKVHAMFNKNSQMKYFFLTNQMRPNPSVQCEPTPSTSSGICTTAMRREPVYNLIYTDSSDDASDPDDPLPVQDLNSAADSVQKGCFVLLEFRHEEKESVKFKYAAVCQSDKDENSDVKVMCLKQVQRSNYRLFKMNENDKTLVKADQILAVLPFPEIEMKGDRMYYKFKKPVDVKEK